MFYKVGKLEEVLAYFFCYKVFLVWGVDIFSLNIEREFEIEEEYLWWLLGSICVCEVFFDFIKFINIIIVELFNG